MLVCKHESTLYAVAFMHAVLELHTEVQDAQLMEDASNTDAAVYDVVLEMENKLRQQLSTQSPSARIQSWKQYKRRGELLAKFVHGMGFEGPFLLIVVRLERYHAVDTFKILKLQVQMFTGYLEPTTTTGKASQAALKDLRDDKSTP